MTDRSNRFKRFMLAIAAALLIAAVLPNAASAAITKWSNITCLSAWATLGEPVPFTCLAEDDDFGGDKITITGSTDIPDLENVTHTQPGLCAPKIIGPDNWNDCVTSIYLILGAADTFCWYLHNDYETMLHRVEAPLASGTYIYQFDDLSTIGDNDKISSTYQQQSSPICKEGGV